MGRGRWRWLVQRRRDSDEQRGRARARWVRRAEEHFVPGGVEVAVVPRHVLLHHGAGERMERDVLDQPLAEYPDPAAVVQGLAVLAAGSQGRSSRWSSTWTVRPRSGLAFA